MDNVKAMRPTFLLLSILVDMHQMWSYEFGRCKILQQVWFGDGYQDRMADDTDE